MYDPYRLIIAKRVCLLSLGILGSIFVILILCISIVDQSRQNLTQPVSTEENWELSSLSNQSFPIHLQNTTLLLERVSAYDGPFLEDGSNREVMNIMALHVINTGNKPIIQAGISLQLDTDTYVFYGEYIPPGIPVVLLEHTAKPYRKDTIFSSSGWQKTAELQQLEGISVTESETGVLMITNYSTNTYCNLSIYHKSWLSPPGVYVGGIAHQTIIPELQPGQTVYIRPQYYAPGYSRLVYMTADYSPT